MAVRIGIDVGGTFTDAVAIDNDTFELIGSVKIPTTHDAAEGVAAGIVESLRQLMDKCGLQAEDVTFIAHGTTQATNALLEGDVEKVGILAMGKGVEGYKVKKDSEIGDIELAPQKYLRTVHAYVNQDEKYEESIGQAIETLQREGAGVTVVTSAYSVDDPTEELHVMERLNQIGMIGTCSHEISKLYGLRIRTRTAVINGSILPKMINTANLTESSVSKSGITSPLMIMRCDGGVMSVKEVKKRPVLTMLSGPAAGVAGALMHEKISEGIFLEVGGTSTDISAVHNGQVMISYAEVGGHKTYVNSLDVRTVGIAGGSMIRATQGNIVDVGPRSAHIAGLQYLVYTPPEQLGELVAEYICPKDGDFPDHIVIIDKTHNKRYALTLACAANASGYVADGDYAKGYPESALRGFDALSQLVGLSRDECLAEIHKKAAAKNKAVVRKLIEEYNLREDQLILLGGGGGASAVVPYLAKEMGMRFRIAKNAQSISPIGVALALVRDIVERTVSNPTQNNILKIRREAQEVALKSGASLETIEVVVEVDPRKNLLRAIATGATELRTKNRLSAKADSEQLLDAARKSVKQGAETLSPVFSNDDYTVFQGEVITKKLLGLMKHREQPVRIVNAEGVVRIQHHDALVAATTVKEGKELFPAYLNKLSDYTDSGERIPEVYVALGARLLDFSKLMNKDQLLSLFDLELSGEEDEKPLALVFGKNS